MENFHGLVAVLNSVIKNTYAPRLTQATVTSILYLRKQNEILIRNKKTIICKRTFKLLNVMKQLRVFN